MMETFSRLQWNSARRGAEEDGKGMTHPVGQDHAEGAPPDDLPSIERDRDSLRTMECRFHGRIAVMTERAFTPRNSRAERLSAAAILSRTWHHALSRAFGSEPTTTTRAGGSRVARCVLNPQSTASRRPLG
jgi:hypothetical protein